MRDAGATAAAASHQCGVAAAAVTAERMVAELSFEELPHRIPPTVAPPRWTAWGTLRAPGQIQLPRPRGREDPYGGGQHSGANDLQSTVDGPLGESARRRDGADEPPSWPPVARCGVDATGPGVVKGPPGGSTRSVPSARNECGDLRSRSGHDDDTVTVGGPGGGTHGDAARRRRCEDDSAMDQGTTTTPAAGTPEAELLLHPVDHPRRRRGLQGAIQPRPHRGFQGDVQPRDRPLPPAAARRHLQRGRGGTPRVLPVGPLCSRDADVAEEHAAVITSRASCAHAGCLTGGAPAAASTPSSGAAAGKAAGVHCGPLVRRRITGKRKIMHVDAHQGGHCPSATMEFSGSASRRRAEGCGVEPSTADADGLHRAAGLGQREEGPAVPRVCVDDWNMRTPRPWGWTCGNAQGRESGPPGDGSLSVHDELDGELNTLKSTSSSSSATAGPGTRPSSLISGSAAAASPLVKRGLMPRATG